MGDDTTTAAAAAAGAPAIDLTGVRFAWPGKRRFELSIDRFAVARGQRVLLIGPSGSGKSTLLSLICGVTVATAGQVRVLDQDLVRLSGAARDRFRAEHVGVIFQMFNLLPYGSVLDNVLLPLSFAPHRRRRAEAAGGARAEALRLLLALGLEEDLLAAAAADLSVGQQQRVAAARALIGAPEIIVADEPTSALDSAHRSGFLELLFAQAAAAGSTLVVVSHDLAVADQFDDVRNLEALQRAEVAA